MLKIIYFQIDAHKHDVWNLFKENLEATNLLVKQEFNIDFDVDAFLAQDIAKVAQFAPPTGRLLLAGYNGKIAGCAGVRKIDAQVGEIKRMYVKPALRRRGIGKVLLQAIIAEARAIGYVKLRLDTAPFAQAAQALYHAVGFQNISPYPESEIPQEYHSQWLFMELIIE